MNAIKSIKGVAIPLNMTDIDTDIIIPAQYLTSTSQSGYGKHAFSRLKETEDFVLNQPQYEKAPILVSGSNFGCGSSREHAVWAIQEMGVQAVVASSFADIFKNNAKKNGLLLIELTSQEMDLVFDTLEQDLAQLNINVETQEICSGNWCFKFQLDPFFKHCLLKGLDEMDYLLSHIEVIRTFKQKQTDTRLFINTQQ